MNEQPTRPSFWRIASRVVARIAYHAIRRKALLLLLIVAAAAWLLAPGNLPIARTAASPTPDAAELYLTALRDRDANDFVQALAPRARQALELRFGTTGVRAAAAFFREQESRGERIVGWERIGSYKTVQGDELRFYVVHYERGDEKRDVSYVLTLDADGKVARVE